MNKQGGFVDLFVFIVVTFVISIIVVVFIFIGNTTTDQLHESMNNMDLVGDGTNNVSVVIDNTIGKVNSAYLILRWASILIFFAMILGIFIGSYMVTTKPVFFVPYIFIIIIAIVVSTVMANAYDELMQESTLQATFLLTPAINWFVLTLPITVTIVGFAGALIMFSRLGKGGIQQ